MQHKNDLGAKLEAQEPPRPTRRAHTMGYVTPAEEELRSTAKAWDDLNPTIQHAEGARPPSIVTLPGVQRGSAGVPIARCGNVAFVVVH